MKIKTNVRAGTYYAPPPVSRCVGAGGGGGGGNPNPNVNLV
jgi:hypothetical protein